LIHTPACRGLVGVRQLDPDQAMVIPRNAAAADGGVE
jgi:hypothetical protein